MVGGRNRKTGKKKKLEHDSIQSEERRHAIVTRSKTSYAYYSTANTIVTPFSPIEKCVQTPSSPPRCIHRILWTRKSLKLTSQLGERFPVHRLRMRDTVHRMLALHGCTVCSLFRADATEAGKKDRTFVGRAPFLCASWSNWVSLSSEEDALLWKLCASCFENWRKSRGTDSIKRRAWVRSWDGYAAMMGEGGGRKEEGKLRG